jgi:vancomycin resistance protein YoaR
MTTDPLVEPELSEPVGPSVSQKGKPKTGSSFRPLPFLLAFAVAVVAFLAIGTAVAMGMSQMYSGRILPSVHVGNVDLSGLNRDQAIAKLTADYSYLSEGQVTVQTPVGTAKITYKEIGRGPDAAAMADAALKVGHQGSPIADAATTVRAVAAGDNVPLMVKLDPTMLAARLRDLTGSNAAVATDAQVVPDGSGYKVVPGTPGHGIDEATIANSIIGELSKPAAATNFQTGGTFVELQPRVSEAQAQQAINLAQGMTADLQLTLGTQSWTVPAATVKTWIAFGMRSDGTYGPVADPALVSTSLTSLATATINQEPVEPTFLTNKVTGKPVGVTGGKDGIVVDVNGTALAIEAYLDALGSGKQAGISVAVVATVTQPKLTDEQAAVAMNQMVKIGSATVVFFPGVSNGNGANIRVPAQLLNGEVVAPGATFSFLDGVGAIDAAHGFKMGGVIIGGKSDHTGAIGGGICSASTTMFHAALAAGLQIVERHPHYYFIDRYADATFPKGSDATVYYNGSSRFDLKWVNDTAYPIVIHGSTTYGATSTITFELWSVPTGRTVAFSKPIITDYQTATNNPPIYTDTLAPGKTNQLEYRTDGFNVSVSRIVKDAAGNVIHSDLFISHYARVNGQLEIGGPAPGQTSPPPSSAPTAPPSSPPSAPPSEAPAASAAAY